MIENKNRKPAGNAIIKLKEIMKYPFDFSMIGMILGSLINE